MKQKFTALLLAAAMLLSLPLLAACQNGKDGKAGKEGESAYEIALRHGFEGTEEEWLESLKGANGKDGTDGTDGTDGKDGTDGEKGEDGKDGENGEDGKDGVNGTVAIPDSDRAYNLALLSAVSIYCNFTISSGWLGQTKSATSAGSGVIYQLDRESGDAYIITNYHVVYAADSREGISRDITIYLYGMEYKDYAIEATYVGGAMNYDVAVLKVEGSEILKNSEARPVSVADSNDIVVGGSAVAIGNPEADGISVTRGIISVDSEELTMIGADDKTQVTFRTIRIDAAVNEGNSGGGLFNSAGQLIGIVNAKIIADGIEGIAYAIPSNIAVGVAQNIIDNSRHVNYNDGVWRCLLGVAVVSTESRCVVDEEQGIVTIVERVVADEITEGGLAEGVIRRNDRFLQITVGEKTYEITRTFVVVDAMLNVRVGDTVTFLMERDGEELELTVEITEDCITVTK